MPYKYNLSHRTGYTVNKLTIEACEKSNYRGYKKI